MTIKHVWHRLALRPDMHSESQRGSVWQRGPPIATERYRLVKVSLQLDCTPEEAREFLGLPDVKPLQAKVLARVEQKLLDATSSLSPEGVLKMWFTVLPQATEHYLKALADVVMAKVPHG